MPSAVPFQEIRLPKWKRPSKTSVNLPWADIEVIDLSAYDLPGGKEKLAVQLREAVCQTVISYQFMPFSSFQAQFHAS